MPKVPDEIWDQLEDYQKEWIRQGGHRVYWEEGHSGFYVYAPEPVADWSELVEVWPTDKRSKPVVNMSDKAFLHFNSVESRWEARDAATGNTIQWWKSSGANRDLAEEEFRKTWGPNKQLIGAEWASSISSNPIDEALSELTKTLTSKRADYANDTDPFSNFTAAARIAGTTPEQSILNLIGVKLARIENLKSQDKAPSNEPLLDSYKDLAGYSVILYAYYKSKEG